MCGICGFNFDNRLLLKKMCDLITHRGPDDEGYYIDSNISLGIRRLSIIDLDTGHQPQHNENEDIWIVFNGEIYNYIDLTNQLENLGHNFYTKSDTETIIHAYEEWGEECVKYLRGQFAFCVYDSIKKHFFLARDHLGLIPLYYYFNGNKFIFGSEIKTILLHNVEKVVDRRAFNLYLSFTYVPFNLTLFKGIYKVPPSNYLIFNLKTKKLLLKNYWDFNFFINRKKSVEQLAKELKDLLTEAVKIRLISDVPLGAFLSGGLDSSAIVGLMAQLTDRPVKTFSVGFGEGAPINETRYAKIVADYFGTDHTELTVESSCYELLPDLIWHLDDLIADAAIIPVFLMAKFAKKRITVALTGDGADEVFAGYSSYYRKQKYKLLQFVPQKPLDLIMKFYKFIPFPKLRHILYSNNQSKTLEDRYIRRLINIPDIEMSNVIPFKNENIKSLIKSTFKKDLDIVNQFTYWDLKYQLPSQFNMKIDKMTMAASLEARVPFLDKELVNWSLTIPSELKLEGNIEKYILRLAMKDILPSIILKRRKCGFSAPINLWFEKGLKDRSKDILSRLEKRNDLLLPSYVRKLRRSPTSNAWNLIIFELWYETFIENEELKPIKF